MTTLTMPVLIDVAICLSRYYEDTCNGFDTPDVYACDARKATGAKRCQWAEACGEFIEILGNKAPFEARYATKVAPFLEGGTREH